MAELLAGPLGPLMIMLLRVADVSLTTLRLLLLVRGARLLIAPVALAEILIWLYAVAATLHHLSSPWHVAGYALGFTAGSLVGTWLESRLAWGLASIDIISRDPDVRVANAIRDLGFGVTEFLGRGKEGEVEEIHVVVPRRDVPRVIDAALRVDSDAFVTVLEPRQVLHGWTPRPGRAR